MVSKNKALLTKEEVDNFQSLVWKFYRSGYRKMPWRQADHEGVFDPYKIVVSEVMLQQTQVTRVAVKFVEFISVFPDFEALAKASLGEVLSVWSGLGYNRRAKYLWESAQIVTKSGGMLPLSIKELTLLPGIGSNTAAAIRVYSFNEPHVFIETNIRTVFLYHFFPTKSAVTDRELLPLIEQTIDTHKPREWYWALMDYGSYLKQTVGNVSKQSRHYTRQSKFEGSTRQIRGKIIRLLTTGSKSYEDLVKAIDDERLGIVLGSLRDEGLIKQEETMYSLH
jgi:A/G-specific adenine glycosylase